MSSRTIGNKSTPSMLVTKRSDFSHEVLLALSKNTLLTKV
jgi:hypothetical protein